MLTGSDQIHIFEYGGSRVTELDSEEITRLSFLYQTCLSELYVAGGPAMVFRSHIGSVGLRFPLSPRDTLGLLFCSQYVRRL